jgi:hypothetical protein
MKVKFMDCLLCKDLDRVLTSTLDGYMAARSSAFYRVCTELAAKKEVDMERAKTALEEHRLVCPFVVMAGAGDSARSTSAAGLTPLPGPKAK